MDDQETRPDYPTNKSELMERIQTSRAELEAVLQPLSEAQLIKPGPSGWSIKDHLAHLAIWELGIAELLRRRNRFAAMQVEEAVKEGKSEDEINAIIYRNHAHLLLAEVMDLFNQAHQKLVEALRDLSFEDLLKPYADYVPEGDERQDPVAYWIRGNTYGHFDEHHGYIQDLLKD
jgi:hypothetical protein